MSDKILLIDSGASKLQGVIIDSKRKRLEFNTSGINLKKENFKSLLIKLKKLPLNQEIKFRSIYFYGAGINSVESKKKLQKAFDLLHISYLLFNAESDLLGSARSLLKKEKGIIAILGTGSNNGFYDGTKITQQILPLGYLLGDEGSGYQIGKQLAQKYLRNQWPVNLIKSLDNYLQNKGIKDFISHVYQAEYPQKEIAGLCIWAKQEIDKPEITKIISTTLNEFAESLFLYYQNFSFKIALSGSISYHFSEILSPILQKYGFEVQNIEQNIIEGLIQYHQKNS